MIPSMRRRKNKHVPEKIQVLSIHTDTKWVIIRVVHQILDHPFTRVDIND